MVASERLGGGRVRWGECEGVREGKGREGERGDGCKRWCGWFGHGCCLPVLERGDDEMA